MAEVRGTAKAVLNVGPAPVEPPISRVLLKAAEEMTQRGFCKGHLISDDDNGECCALGAIGLAAGMFHDFESSVPVRYEDIAAHPAAEYLADYIRNNHLLEKYSRDGFVRLRSRNKYLVNAMVIYVLNDWTGQEIITQILVDAATAAFEEGL